MQDWQYGEGLIYLRPICRRTKLVFLRARATLKKITIKKKGKPALCCTASLTFSFVLYLIYFYPIPQDRRGCRRYAPKQEKSVIIIYTCQNILISA